MSYQTNTPVSEGLLHVHMFLPVACWAGTSSVLIRWPADPTFGPPWSSCSSPPPGTTSSRNSCTPTYFP